MFIYLVIIIIISTFFYFLATYKKRPKPSKFTPIIHLRNNSDDSHSLLDNLFLGKVKFINSNYDSDIVFLGYIINNWETLPNKMIFLRDIGWSKKKAIISVLNKIDDIWGEQPYMNLDHYIQYIISIYNQESECNKSKNIIESNDKDAKIFINKIKQQSTDIYVNYDYSLLQREEFKIFWTVYMLPFFGELHKSIPKIMNINKQQTTGQFIVEREQFYYRPIQFYISLLKYLKDAGTNYLPVLWDVILS